MTAQIKETIGKYQENLEQAIESDNLILKKFQSIQDNLKILVLPREILESKIPTVTINFDVSTHPSVRNVNEIMIHLNSLSANRGLIRSDLNNTVQNDDISTLYPYLIEQHQSYSKSITQT
jgi:hypothetical protein